MAFERFIKNDLTVSINDIFYEINKYIDARTNMNTNVLCINIKPMPTRTPCIDYLLCIADRIESYMLDFDIDFVHGKGKRKREIQKLYDELKAVCT